MEEKNAPKGANEDTAKSKTPLIIVLVILLVAVVGAAAYAFISKDGDAEEETAAVASGGLIGYESNVVVADSGSLQDLVDEMYKKAAEGNMALEYKNVATSSDGRNFSCYIANSAENSYDMFLALYPDAEYDDDPLFLTQLIPLGSAIESFTIDDAYDKLEKGSTDYVLVFTQVEEDHSTIHAQIAVTLTLTVS